MVARKFYCSIIFILGTLFISCAHTSSVTRGPSDLFASASDNLKKQRFEEAKYEFRQFVNNFPESNLADDALYRLGYISCVQGKYFDAEGFFVTLIDDYPKSEWVFDADVWRKLLEKYRVAADELETVKKKLNSSKVETGTAKTSSPAPVVEEVDKLQDELNRLKEDNRKLRELIESME